MSMPPSRFRTNSGTSVWFGVGTFGTNEDAMMGLGNCYRLKVRDTNCGDINGGELLEREIIAQAINTGKNILESFWACYTFLNLFLGHDVSNIQFDLQVGNGGTGAFNNCAGQSWSMFPGPFTEDIWGHQYGGCDYRDER